MEESWLHLTGEFFAAAADFLFQLVKESGIVFADSVEEAREKKFARGMRAGEETGDEIAGAMAFPFLTRELRRIDEGAIGFVAVQKTFFEEAIECGHDGSVSERAAELLDDLANRGITGRPENFHQFEFESAESGGQARVAAGGETIFEETNHLEPSIEPMPGTGEIVIPPVEKWEEKPGNRPNETATRVKNKVGQHPLLRSVTRRKASWLQHS